MNIEFGDSFSESLKRLVSHQTWWYKTYKFFRYDIINFVKNVWHFKRELWDYRWWDYRFTLQMIQASIKGMYPNFERYGIEIDETRIKKVDKMIRACLLLENFIEDNFLYQAEKQVGELFRREWEFEEVPDKPGYSQLVDNLTEEEKAHNGKVYDRANEIEEEQWNELWEIIRGQNSKKLNRISKVVSDEKKRKTQKIKFDGSDMRSWWD